MPKQQLLDTLAELQAELAAMQQVDQPTRAELERVIDQIRRQLDESDAPHATDAPASPDAASGESEDETLTTQLQDFMLSIETDHPRLTRAVNQVAAALANLGI